MTKHRNPPLIERPYDPAAPAPLKPVFQAATRFAAIYFTLFFFPWPILALFVSDRFQTVTDHLVSGVMHFWKPLVDFAASGIFRVGHPVSIAFANTRSGDRLFDWLVDFWVWVIAGAATAVWTLARPHDKGHTRTYLRTYLRYTLGTVLLTYGSLKLSQFPPPFYSVLNKTFAEETPMGLLWTFIGASTGYTVCVGLLEILCGALLLFRRTVLLGACLALALTLNIFLLNLFYDVPVKLFSFHLLLAALILLAPDFGRLAGMFLLNRPVPSREEPRPGRSGVVTIVKALFVVYLLCSDVAAALEGYAKRTAPKSAIEGIWKVAHYAQGGGGKLAPWQWLTIDKFGDAAFFHVWSADGSGASGPVKGNTLSFQDPGQTGSMTLHLVGKDELAVDGTLAGVETSIQLRRQDQPAPLVNRPIHWIQDAPAEP